MKNRSLKKSFTYAFRGIYKALQTESNMRRHFVSAIIAILLGILFNFTLIEWAIITLAIIGVFVAELLNTAVEYTIDMTCGDVYTTIAAYAKDIAAGATLLAAIGSVIIGLLLYLPKLIDILKEFLT